MNARVCLCRLLCARSCQDSCLDDLVVVEQRTSSSSFSVDVEVNPTRFTLPFSFYCLLRITSSCSCLLYAVYVYMCANSMNNFFRIGFDNFFGHVANQINIFVFSLVRKNGSFHNDSNN